MGRCISDRFDHFPGCEDGAPGTTTPATLSENASMVFSFDALDAPCMDAYTNSAVPFADGHYLMFPSMYVLRQMFLLILLLESCNLTILVCRYKHFPNPPQWFKANDGMWDGRILHSRDGLTYE